MAQVTIKINSREYAVACGDGQESHIIKLSRMLDEKAKQLTTGGGHINENMLLAMVGLLLADELTEARKMMEGCDVTSVQASAKSPISEEKNISRAEQQVNVVEKIVEVPVEPDLSPLDAELGAVLTDVAKQILAVSSEIEKL